MNKIFTVTLGMDLSMRLSIDTKVLTQELSRDIASFWATSTDVLEASDGDHYEAIARYAVARLWFYMLDGYSEAGAVAQLHKQDGWCIPGDILGITILDHELPDIDPIYLEVERE